MWPCQPSSASIPAPPRHPSDLALDSEVERSPAVVRVFLRHVPDQLASLASALSNGDLEALHNAAHKLKGSCVSVGVPRMAALCVGLEASSEARGARELKAQLDSEFALVQELLTQDAPALPLKIA